MIENMKKQNDVIVNPIYEWSDYDIWNYVQTREVKVNPLYAKGYKRVGCIGCPMSNYKGMMKEFADYPKYKLNYIRAFERMLKVRAGSGKVDEWKTGQDVFDWWVGEWERNIRGQITIDDYLKGNE